MSPRQLETHIRYVLSMQTHRLHEARKACRVYTRSYRDAATPEQLAVWRQQMAELDLADGARNLSPAVAALYEVEQETQQWANRCMRPLMDWTRSPQGMLRQNDN